jgi:peptide/nickel transport system substrate-binding protein
MRLHDIRASLAIVVIVLLSFASVTAAHAAEGELRWGIHVTLAARWLDPAETEALATPFMVLYAVHDALVKPMPAGMLTPSLAESCLKLKK